MSEGKIQSIKQRLKNISIKKNIAYDYILMVYMMEGLLNRLSKSRFKSNFILKDGFLLSSLIEKFGRTTRDLDLEGKDIENSTSRLKEIFIEISQIKIDDELIYKTDKLYAESIIENDIYSGIRITVPCFLGRSRQSIQIDIGFGDIITPDVNQSDLITVLENQNINLFVYPIETIIAEKFEAMISLDEANSRMKDFFDLYSIIQNMEIDTALLFTAIRNTFHTRKTIVPDTPAIYSDNFRNNPDKLKQWNAFLNRINYEGFLEFSKVCKRIQEYFDPLYKKLQYK